MNLDPHDAIISGLATTGYDCAKLSQATLNEIAHGQGGATEQTYLLGTSGSARIDSLRPIAGLAASVKNEHPLATG